MRLLSHGRELQAENGVQAKAKESLLWRVSDTLDYGSPFASSISQLSKAADSVLGSHAAKNGRCVGGSVNCWNCKSRVLSAGGRYRAGKASLLPEGYYGLIRAASMLDGFMFILTPGIFAERSGSLFLYY